MTDLMWCFQCRTSYDHDVETCVECGVGLVEHEPKSAENVGGEDDPQLGYELHDWAFESRRMLEGLLTNAELDHAWQGATLIILEADEAKIDELVEAVERSTLPTLDPDKPKIAVGMEEWSAELQTKLTDQLSMAGVPTEFDENGDLVFHEEDEEVFDRVVDMLGEGDDDEDDDEEKVDLDGLALNSMLTEVFMATQTLARDPLSSPAMATLLEQSVTMGSVRTPFGFNKVNWKGLIYQIDELVDMLREGAEANEITDKASHVRDQLHQLI